MLDFASIVMIMWVLSLSRFMWYITFIDLWGIIVLMYVYVWLKSLLTISISALFWLPFLHWLVGESRLVPIFLYGYLSFFEAIYLRMKAAAAAECIISLTALWFPFSLLIFTVEILDQGSVATPQTKGLSLFFTLKQACVYKGYLCTG